MMNGIRSIKRGLAVLLSACLVFGMTPVQAGAEETTSGNELRAENDHYQNGFCVNGKVENGVYVHNADCSYDGCCGYEPAVLKEKVTFYDNYKGEDVTLSSAYEIANAGQLYWFAGVVNGDENVCKGGVPKNTRVNAILTADITINQNVLTTDGQLNEADKSSFLKWTPIGGDGNDNIFYGAINGNHHVIRGLYADEDRDYVGLIGKSNTYVSYSGGNYYCVSVEQLGIEDSYIKGNNYVGALAGLSYASVYACYNTGTVVAAGKYAGGIQGKFTANSTYCDFTYCYNRGSVTGADYVGGITGSFDGSMVRMRNCYNTGRVSGKKDNVHMIAGWVDAASKTRISDCYYDNSSGADDAYATGLNAGAFASGEAAYLLNIYKKKKQTVRFRQTIGTDLYPVLASGSKEVYAQAVVNCDGTPSEESIYTNEQIDESVKYTAHKIDAFGICTICGKYAEPHRSTDKYYEITNAGELYWFAEQVNGGYGSLKARIMKDIVVNEGTFTQNEDGKLLYNGEAISDSNKPREWTPIGENRNSYSGIIDGQYHTISGLYNGQCGQYAGFLGDCVGNVKNMGVVNSCFVKASGSSGVGGIAGRIDYSGEIYNCYFQGILIMQQAHSTYGLIGEAKKGSLIRNCYCIDSQNIQSYQGIEAVSAEALASGEAAWRLNQNNVTYKYNDSIKDYDYMKDAKMVWGQVLTGENQTSYPSAYQESLGNAVYRNVSKYQVCEHVKEPTDYADEKNANRVIEYSFGNTQTKPEFVTQFQWNENEEGKHVCSVCGSEQEHENVYSVEEDNHKITASCLYDSSEDRGSLMITAPEYPEGEKAVTYDGSAKDVKVENTIEGVKPKVIYTYQADGSDTTETLSEGVKPMDAGSYTASVSLTGADNNTATVSVTFTIEQATPTIAWAEDQTKQSVAYTGDEIDVSKLTAPTVTLLNGETFSDTDNISYSYRELEYGIASGDFSSGLPTERGTYEIKASIPASGNYTAAEGTMTLEIKWLYLDDVAATLTDQNGKTLNPDMEWWATSVTLTAPEGYTINDAADGTYGSSFTYSEATDDNGREITYYLKNKDGEIGKKTVTVRIADPNNCNHVDEKGTDSEGNETNEPDGFCDKCGTSYASLGYLNVLITKAETIIIDVNNTYSKVAIESLQKVLDNARNINDASSQDEIKTASDNLLNALNGLKNAHTIVTVSCNPANSGILDGGGKYEIGDEIILKAQAVDGFVFVGWYDTEQITESAKPLSKETTYTYGSVNEQTPSEISLYAVYKSNENRKLSVTVGNGSVEYSYQNGTQTGTWNNDFTNNGFARGSYFTLTAKPSDGYTFLYWINQDGRVISDSLTYSFYLGDNMELQACYKKTESSEAESQYVIFKDMSGKILWSGDVTMDKEADGTKYGTVTAPAHGTFTGYTFKQWKDASGKVMTVDDNGCIKITEAVTIYAEYEAESGLTLTVDGAQREKTYSYGSLVTVTADESKDNKYFSGWYIGDKLVSDKKAYSFYITGNTEITAKYEGDEVITQKPLVNMTMGDRTTLTDGKQTVVMNVTWSIPEGYEMIEAGLVRTLEDAYSNQLELDKVDKTNVKKNPSKLITAGGTMTYTLTLGAVSAQKNLYARGYLTYRNVVSGEVITVYTDTFTSNVYNN